MSQVMGATAVGIRASDGVVLAADRRMSYGSFIVSRNARKVFRVGDRIGVATAGLYGDISGLLRIVETEMRYYETTYNTRMSLKALAKLLSNILYSSKFFPYYVEVIVGGIDRDGKPRVYVLDPVGAITEESFIAVGTGATTALGVLEAEYRDGITVEEAEELAIRAVRAAIARDAGSGDGVDVLAITRDGWRERSVRFRVVQE